MKKLLMILLLLSCLAVPAEASEIMAPPVPEMGQELMPDNTENFGESLQQLLRNGIVMVLPDLNAAVETCVQILFASVLLSLILAMPHQSGKATSAAAAIAVAALVFHHTDTLIPLAADTVTEICEYGKLLCPVMTAALAAQGAVTTSTALYMGTAMFTALLSAFLSRFFLPMVYAYLIFSVANAALGEAYLKKFAESISSLLSWLLKTLLIVFTTYLSITGVVAGTTDAAALKAAKVSISTAVPVIGGILSDASEAVLVSMGLMKNAAGIYGILAVLAIFLGPFLKVGLPYLALKLTASLCSIFADKNVHSLINDFASAMGLLLAMLASACTMVLISTVCFLRGVT